MDEVKEYVLLTLPTLIHLQICEGLQGVLGHIDELQKNILDYENKKIKEIYEYTEMQRKEEISLDTMAFKLEEFMLIYAKEQNGVMPLSYQSLTQKQ